MVILDRMEPHQQLQNIVEHCYCILEFHYGTMNGIELTRFMLNVTGLCYKYDIMTRVGAFHSNI